MPNEISRVNRKIKSAVSHYLKNYSSKSLDEMIKLTKQREELLKAKLYKRSA